MKTKKINTTDVSDILDTKSLIILQLEKELEQNKIDLLLFKQKEKDLLSMNKELVIEYMEKEKLSAQLVTVNKELVIEYLDKEKKAATLKIANKELLFQNKEKQNRANELIIANKELLFQNKEKGKRADELIVANKELAFQSQEKQNREEELTIANKELAFQNEEKQNRADELAIANTELIFQNKEKQNRADELIIANQELAFQNQEKQNRADELAIANKELVFQNEEKQNRADELIIANKELESFNYISSHDLQEPLRKIQILSGRILDTENQNLTDHGKHYFSRIQLSAGRMQQLIQDLLIFSRLNNIERKFGSLELNKIIEEVKNELKEAIEEKHATIEIVGDVSAKVILFQFRQLMRNLIGNALKFSKPETHPHIKIKCSIEKGEKLNAKNTVTANNFSSKKNYCHIKVADNGIGFDNQFSERIFEVFQRLHHSTEEYDGTGIGLAIVKKIVQNHKGIITATGKLNKGAIFDIYIPAT